MAARAKKDLRAETGGRAKDEIFVEEGSDGRSHGSKAPRSQSEGRWAVST